jgi:hypothetical protein
MEARRENQNRKPISTRNGNHEDANDNQLVGRNSGAHSASFAVRTNGAIRCAIAPYGNRPSINAVSHRPYAN